MIKKFFKLWTPVLIWAGLIFYLSSIPNLSSGLEKFWDTLFRKMAHLFEYGIFFLLLARALKKPLVWSVIFSILYAISDEIHQGFVPGRYPAIADLCFDTAGILLAYLIYPNLKLFRNFLGS
jgi:VanZ family protein